MFFDSQFASACCILTLTSVTHSKSDSNFFSLFQFWAFLSFHGRFVFIALVCNNNRELIFDVFDYLKNMSHAIFVFVRFGQFLFLSLDFSLSVTFFRQRSSGFSVMLFWNAMQYCYSYSFTVKISAV